ncbi:LPXTG cell wall anchor domain-containing protein, partial [Streptococcus gwangjuense]
TIELPARLLVEKGKIVKNDFHQIDFGNAFVSNLVTLQVPDLKPEKHAVDQKDDKKIRDGQEIKIGEYLRYFLDGVTVPAKHDTLYQYDGIDKLDVKHDRYTGNWKGIIRGTEYVAEKELTLPYDVVLSNGKVVKAGDKIAKGSAYAFQFEFDQSTNSNFIKKIVKVTWNEKEGKWAYTIDKDFLNSLGVKGTFDADFYIEVERIAAGKVENTFINTVNLQEMTAKVTTTTPEPPKPEPKEPHKPQASLPNTGTAASMLPVVGMILGLLSLAGLRKYKK